MLYYAGEQVCAADNLQPLCCQITAERCTLYAARRKKAVVEAGLEAQGFDRMAKKGQVSSWAPPALRRPRSGLRMRGHTRRMQAFSAAGDVFGSAQKAACVEHTTHLTPPQAAESEPSEEDDVEGEDGAKEPKANKVGCRAAPQTPACR